MTIPGAIWSFDAQLHTGDVDVWLYLPDLERTPELDAFIADTVHSFGERFIKGPGAGQLWQGTLGPEGVEPIFGVALFVREGGRLYFMAFTEERDADAFFHDCATRGPEGRLVVFNGAHVVPGGRA